MKMNDRVPGWIHALVRRASSSRRAGIVKTMSIRWIRRCSFSGWCRSSPDASQSRQSGILGRSIPEKGCRSGSAPRGLLDHLDILRHKVPASVRSRAGKQWVLDCIGTVIISRGACTPSYLLRWAGGRAKKAAAWSMQRLCESRMERRISGGGGAGRAGRGRRVGRHRVRGLRCR
jgi:hypothetical protein